MEQLPIEARLQHEVFCRKCKEMSPEQRLDMLITLHALYLNQTEYLKTVMRESLGITVIEAS